MESPKITQFEEGFKVMPKNIGVLIMDYFVLPDKPFMDYTTGANDEIIYNSAGSTQLQWSQTMLEVFLPQLAMRFGKFTQNPALFQAGLLTKQSV
jgi:hypothetical protein